MCPLWPYHHIIMYLILFFTLWLAMCMVVVHAGDKLQVTFDREEAVLLLQETQIIYFNATDDSIFQPGNLEIEPTSGEKFVEIGTSVQQNVNNHTGWFNLTGKQLGRASVAVKTKSGQISDSLSIRVLRKERVLDQVFTYSVIILVSIIYINFGCALDWDVLKKTIKRPIGPAIGFACQFVFMPLISFGLGRWIFPESPAMQLGLFFTGLSPAGGASNIWSVALDANVNLSITMTTLSTIGAFAMFPFWLFTLGHYIFAAADTVTPYEKIATYVIALVVPLAIGLLCQKYLPRFSKFMVKILKPFSALLILFIIIFACVANDYLFKLFTWKIVVAGMALPWLGYLGGFLVALALRQPKKDILAIAVETGVQNTGISIFMLKFVLGQPDADLTTVIPVSISIMTPIPLTILLIFLKLYQRNRGKTSLLDPVPEDNVEISAPTSKESKDINLNGSYILH